MNARNVSQRLVVRLSSVHGSQRDEVHVRRQRLDALIKHLRRPGITEDAQGRVIDTPSL